MPDSPHAAVTTGSAGDLGRALCDSFLAGRYTVYAADGTAVSPRPGLQAVALDVTDRQAVTALAERAGRETQLEVDQRLTCPVLQATAADW
jgi:NAD(P)-dependent dehydrogenase (short-subunit alcohol dehydrogenase family)